MKAGTTLLLMAFALSVLVNSVLVSRHYGNDNAEICPCVSAPAECSLDAWIKAQELEKHVHPHIGESVSAV